MIKASAGGGGKGMRIARNDDDARYLNETSQLNIGRTSVRNKVFF
jgi:acetyl/propionyl-CoA carboxylase alpha subunit